MSFKVDHPQLAKLRQLHRDVRRRVPNAREGLGEIGLYTPTRVSRLVPGEYWCSPRNAGRFAWTGGDGHHYSLLVIDGKITEESPVILSRPDFSDYKGTMIVGENLYDFLCLGMWTGYFNLLYDGFDDGAHARGPYDTELSEVQTAVLREMTNAFDLRPWVADDGAKLKGLQSIRKSLALPNRL